MDAPAQPSDQDAVARDVLDRLATRWLAPDAVGLRQVPATSSIALSLVVVAVAVEPLHPELLVAATVVTGLAMAAGFLAPWPRWPRPALAALPLAQMVAIALLDLGVGSTYPSFDVLLFLPLATLALRPEKWGPRLALLGSGVVLLAPAVVDVGRVYPLLHACVTSLILTPVVLGAHGLVDSARRQAVELQSARDALARRARELEDSRDTLRSIMQAATEQAIVAIDSAGVVLSASNGAERIFGRPLDELIGTGVTRLLVPAPADVEPAAGPRPDDDSPDDRRSGEGAGGESDVLRVLVGSAAAGGTHVAEWQTVLPNGSTRPLELVVTARRPPDSQRGDLPSGYLVVATDVSARYEEQRQQDEFIGLVTHELRTPLASILGYLDLMRLDDHGLDEEQLHYLGVVERNAERLRLLVDDLLASAQLVLGGAGSVEELDVVDVVRAAVASQAPIAAASGVHVTVTGDVRVPLVSDNQRLTQVVDNLVSNAVKYSLSGGEVVVEVRSGTRGDGARVARVRVIDEGTGIAPEELSRLTERFYRTKDTRRRRVRGVGLGLSLVEAIVGAHGGSLTIDSEPGVGTRVEVELPDLDRVSQRP